MIEAVSQVLSFIIQESSWEVGEVAKRRCDGSRMW